MLRVPRTVEMNTTNVNTCTAVHHRQMASILNSSVEEQVEDRGQSDD